MTRQRIGAYLTALIALMDIGGSIQAEVVSVNLEIPYCGGDDCAHQQNIATYWLSQDLYCSNNFAVTGDANVNLTMQFNSDNYLPARLSYANITSGSVALTNMTFHIQTSYDPLTTMHLLTQNIGGSIYGSAIELCRVHGAIEGPYPWSKEIRSFQAKDNIGILVNAGEYVVFDSTFEWFTYGHFSETYPLPAMMTGGIGKIEVSMESVMNDVATYKVDIDVPIQFRIMTGIFDYISFYGSVPAGGTFTRQVGKLEPMLNNSDFTAGLEGWSIEQGDGIETINWNGTNVVELTTGSPQILSQLIDTPANEYVLRFDYLFEQELGTLNVALSGTTLASIVSDGITGAFQTYSIPVDDPNLIGIHDANLQFIFDGPESGLKLLLDNVGAPNPAPEPGDFNIDNIVNAGDLVIWQTGFGLVADANIYNGDADEDGDVDGIDFLFWQQQAGNKPSSNSLSQAVPEPSTAYCAILFGMSLWGVIMLSKQP